MQLKVSFTILLCCSLIAAAILGSPAVEAFPEELEEGLIRLETDKINLDCSLSKTKENCATCCRGQEEGFSYMTDGQTNEWRCVCVSFI